MMTFKAKILQLKLESIRNSFNDKAIDKTSADLDRLKKESMSSLIDIANMLNEIPSKDRKIIGEALNETKSYIESR